MILQYPKRLIEVDLPIKRISAHARREKSIRHGHISTLHIWWARRPLAACRAVICGALWPDPADPLCPAGFIEKAREEMLSWTSHERQNLLGAESCARFEKARRNRKLFDDPVQLRSALLDFIADFANWDNSTVPEYLETSRALTQAAHEALGGPPGTRPLVVDPFCGGGSIPLEALRVGADAFASDLNPIPVLLNKVVLEYIPKYGQRLADEVRKWGDWIKRAVERELTEFYPKDADGATPIAYLWARTIQCEGPSCGAEVPLLRSLWLAKRSRHSVALEIVLNRRQRRLDFQIIENAKAANVGRGTCAGGTATCPLCGFTTPVESVRSQMVTRKGGAQDARLISVVTNRPDKIGQFFRSPTAEDKDAVEAALVELKRRIDTNSQTLPLIPDGHINHLRGFFNVVLYGITEWGHIFTPRQALTLSTLARLVRDLPLAQTVDVDAGFIEAVKTGLALIVDRVAVRCTANCIWDATTGCIMQVFNQGQSLPARWEFAEMSPCIDAGSGWATCVDYTIKVMDHVGSISHQGHAERASATAHPLPNDAAQAIITDPPYYAAIPYADLSDFFFSWLKRSLTGLHEDLLKSDLTEKKRELVSLAHRAAMYREKDNQWFEQQMGLACAEARRVCVPNGLGVFVFANKETQAWEAMLAGLINAGWVVTASWPIDTESGNRLRAKASAALASSIHLVCRPRENPDGSVRVDEIGDWRDVLSELPRRIHEWMPRLAEEGVVGADAIFACLGPALEIFSRYSRVEKASGETVSLKEYLEQVWAAVAKEALVLVFKDADTASFEADARLTAMWLWTLNAANGADGNEKSADEESEEESEGSVKKPKVTGFILEYDAARKIAQGLGANLEQLDSLVEIKGDTARLLPVAERARSLFGKSEGKISSKRKSKEPQLDLFKVLEDAASDGTFGDTSISRPGETVLDRIHQAMILFAAGRAEAVKRFLVEDGVGRDQRFWRLAQALSALYPTSTDEKRWVDGILARKKGLGL
ncbi:MAG: putative methylase [Verrucomicrobiota bacterium]